MDSVEAVFNLAESPCPPACEAVDTISTREINKAVVTKISVWNKINTPNKK
jgi:hypothetical protein